MRWALWTPKFSARMAKQEGAAGTLIRTEISLSWGAGHCWLKRLTRLECTGQACRQETALQRMVQGLHKGSWNHWPDVRMHMHKVKPQARTISQGEQFSELCQMGNAQGSRRAWTWAYSLQPERRDLPEYMGHSEKAPQMPWHPSKRTSPGIQAPPELP